MATLDDLWNAMVQVESGGNPNKVGAAGEIGLVQIKPSTAADYGVDAAALRHPEVQRMLFNHIMTKYLNHFGSLPKAVAAWNAGQHGVDIGHYPSAYVNKVLALYTGRPSALAGLAPAAAPVRRMLARSSAPAFFTSAAAPEATDAETPTPEAVPATTGTRGRRTHPTVAAATGYLEDRMHLMLMTMGVPPSMAQLYAGAYGSSYDHPAGQARLINALAGGLPGLNDLIATDAPKVQSMARS